MGVLTDDLALETKEPQFDEQPSVLQKLQKWGDYAAYGEAVVPTKFLPMKTPLGSEILENWNLEDPPRHPLSISILQQQLCDKRIGMIIDLSNHESLYGADLRETGILYERVPLVAKIFPAQHAVNKVVEKAERFWGEYPHLYIGIHCAYGFNRTGFVLCSYLIQVCNYSVQEALESFALARPPGIRHEQFIAELHKRYSGWRLEHPVGLTSSFSELRGFTGDSNRQRVDSLQSDFLGVAEHLHDNHPSIAGRLSGVSAASVSYQGSSILETPVEEVFGSSPPLDPSQRPALKNRGGLAGSSTRSLQASNCESVNNESLDLDERDIYQHFARRQELPSEGIVNGHHRRPALKSMLPVIAGPDSRSPTASPAQSTPSQKSPFSASAAASEQPFADGRETDGDFSARRQQDGAECLDSLQPSEIPAEPGGAHRSGFNAPLVRAPISARIFRENSKASWKAGHSEGSPDPTADGDTARRRPCTIM